MERLSRRDFLKTSILAASSTFVPDLLAKREILPPEPLTGLPIIFTKDTPVIITYLDHRGRKLQGVDAELTTFMNVPVDILPPIAPIRVTELGIQPWANYDYAWVAKLPHITGSPTEFLAVVAWGDSEFYRLFNGTLLSKGDGVISTYAYSERPNIYANKIWNDLTAFAAIAKWQKDNGPLMPGDEFSYIKMTNIIERVYKDYKQSVAYWAGGICATVTTISKAVFLASAQGYTEELRRTRHIPIYEYWASPLDPGITKANSDASVKFILESNPDERRNIDYRFKVRQDSDTPLYLSFNAHLEYDNEPDMGNDFYPPADARFTMSATLTKKLPENDEEGKLLGLRDEYAQFHQFSS